MLGEQEARLLLASASNRISKAQLRAQWPGGGLEHPGPVVSAELRAARADEDSEAVDLAVLLAFHTGLRDEYVPLLDDLLAAGWHRHHEQVASALQQLASPISVPVLAATVTRRFDYLDYELDYNALAVKCLWALGDIALLGDAAAERALHDLDAGSLDPDPEETIRMALTAQLARLSTGKREAALASLRDRRAVQAADTDSG